MYVTIVYVHVKEQHIDDFIKASKVNHLASVEEPGNRRFDVLQQAESQSEFVLYEAYSTEQDAIDHKSTAHYLAWRETVSDWMSDTRQGISYTALLPE